MPLRSLSRVAARRRAKAMVVALGKYDNAAAARDRPALRGFQVIELPALRCLDRRTHAFKSTPCQLDHLKAADITELLGNYLYILTVLLGATRWIFSRLFG